VQAVSNARLQLKGDDLELFERLIARPRSALGSFDMIRKWRNREMEQLRGEEKEKENWPFYWRGNSASGHCDIGIFCADQEERSVAFASMCG